MEDVLNLTIGRKTLVFRGAAIEIAKPFEKTFDDISREIAKRVLTAIDVAFDPYQIAYQAGKLSEEIDRCFALRTEYFDLRIQGLRTALEHQLFIDQRDSMRTLELNASAREQQVAQRDGQENAANSFNGNEPLISGLREAYAGLAKASQLAIDWEDQRTPLVEEKWKVLSKYQDALLNLSTAPGGPLNYDERVKTLLEIFEQEFSQVLRRLVALSAALPRIFGIQLDDLCISEAEHPLDDILIWTRALISKLEVASDGLTAFEYTVSLSYGAPGSIFSRDDFKNQLKNSLVEFDLTSYFPEEWVHLSLAEVGLSFLYDADKDSRYKSRLVMNAVVFLPTQTPLLCKLGQGVGSCEVGSSFRDRGPVFVSPVPLAESNSPVRWLQGANIENVSPKGKWAVRVLSPMIGEEFATRKLADEVGNIDIQLHLKLKAILPTTPVGVLGKIDDLRGPFLPGAAPAGNRGPGLFMPGVRPPRPAIIVPPEPSPPSIT